MTVKSARLWLMWATLGAIAIFGAFYLSAPAFDYPLRFNEGLRLAGLVLPTFLGYLSIFVYFVINPPASVSVPSSMADFLAPLVRGPVLIVFGLNALILYAFAHSQSAQDGAGMTFDNLFMGTSLLLGVLSASTSMLVGYLFAGRVPAEPLALGGASGNVYDAAKSAAAAAAGADPGEHAPESSATGKPDGG